MEKIRIGIILSLIALCSALYADDELTPVSGWYARFEIGTSNASDPQLKIPSGPLPADLGSSPIFGGGLGYSLVPGLRADLTFTYRSRFDQVAGFDSMPQGTAEFHSLATLLSFYLDALSSARVSP